MSYVIRLIAAALFLFGNDAFAQTCTAGASHTHSFTYGLETPQSACISGCFATLSGMAVCAELDNICTAVYHFNGSSCSDSGDSPGGGDNEDPPPNPGGGNGENSPNPGGGSGGGESEETPPESGEDGDNGETPGNDSGGSDNDNNTPPPNEPGIPNNAIICNEKNEYHHDCYRYIDHWDEWAYMDMDEAYPICDLDEDKEDWWNCFFNGELYRDGEGWKSWYAYKKDECEYEYRHYVAIAKQYCANRYRDSNEARLYDAAMFGTLNGKNVTGGLSGNSTIDIGKRFGIGKNGNGSLSSAIPDLLEDDAPDEDGEFGVCLKDITIEIFGREIVLHFSRVCPWLEHLGTIFLFLSLFAAIRIIYRG